MSEETHEESGMVRSLKKTIIGAINYCCNTAGGAYFGTTLFRWW